MASRPHMKIMRKCIQSRIHKHQAKVHTDASLPFNDFPLDFGKPAVGAPVHLYFRYHCKSRNFLGGESCEPRKRKQSVINNSCKVVLEVCENFLFLLISYRMEALRCYCHDGGSRKKVNILWQCWITVCCCIIRMYR